MSIPRDGKKRLENRGNMGGEESYFLLGSRVVA